MHLPADVLQVLQDAVKKGSRLNRIKDDFRQAQNKIEQMQISDDWENPLDLLAARIPVYIPEEMKFVCDPHLILRSNTSDEEWQRLTNEAKNIMDGYNRDLKSAIDADKENSESSWPDLNQVSCLHAETYGFDDEKRADAFKAETIAEHFPGMTAHIQYM